LQTKFGINFYSGILVLFETETAGLSSRFIETSQY